MKTRWIIAFTAFLAFAVNAQSQAKPEEKDPALKMSQAPRNGLQAIQQYAVPAIRGGWNSRRPFTPTQECKATTIFATHATLRAIAGGFP